jgi:histone-lysine N-methyltransferase SETMAR
MQSKGVLLRQDNECPYSAVAIVEARRRLKFELFPHPQYSMDLAQSDYHMFGPLQEAIARTKI